MKRKTKQNFFNAFIAVIAMAVFITGCSFFSSFTDKDESDVEITSLSLGKSSLSLKVGGLDYVSLKITPITSQKDVKVNWTYDSSIIEGETSSYGITIKALAEGTTVLKAGYGSYESVCIISVSGYEDGYVETTDPYIYSNTSILQTSIGITEKVFVSLYGGSAADIDGYTWSNENSSVAEIQATGQYCLITAKSTGYSRIKITHSKATYPYYIGVYVFSDNTKVPYITTSNNILTLNKDDAEQTISCNLVDGSDSAKDSDFSWEILSSDSEQVPVSISSNANKAVVTPKTEGSCTIRITHPEATYPLDILCRVITIVKNVYIEPDNTIVTLSGENEQIISSTLKNIDTSEYSIDDYEYKLDDYDVAEIVGYSGNQVILKGKANGSCKLIISHPKSVYSREVLCIVNGQLKDAVDSSVYITTTQNYIRTKVGNDATTLNISLKGGEDGDEGDFTWTVKSTAVDGSSDVIQLETANGSVISSRAAASTYAYGTAVITPKAEGTAVITITHPKVVYPTEILVKVLDSSAVLENPLYFSGEGLVKILNGESADYTVNLKGDSKKDSDDNNISYEISDSRLSLIASANTVNITAPALNTGCTTSTMTISHPKVDTSKTVVVMTADDEETLDSMKALYADKNYYNLEYGASVIVTVNTVGFDGEDSSYDYSKANWTTTDSTVISVEKNSTDGRMCTVKALKAGSVNLTVSIEDYSYTFKITVYPEGAIQTDPEVYFTTTQNVVNLIGEGSTKTVSITALNLSSSEYSNITWEIEDSNVATVIPNGTKATITAVADGETVIKVNHSNSQNELKIYVRVGSEYVIPEVDPTVYISAQDVITMLKDDSVQKLQAVLVNYSEADSNGFKFSIDNEDIAKISTQSVNGIAYIKPVSAGQAEISITHPATSIVKHVLVVVGNTAEDLAAYQYLTTSTNVVAIGEGSTKTVSVSVKNSAEVIVDGYSWSSEDLNIVDITTTNGATAVFKANKCGTTTVKVRNTACSYPLEIIVQVVDPIAAAANPYIQLSSSVLTLNVSSTYTNITADLVGGSEEDYSDFIWSVNDSSICSVYGQNEVGKIKALKAGTTYVTVSHPKAMYTAQLLVVCDEVAATECYISVPSSIIAMKPTDSSQTITASLVNGSTNDKYNFTWSLDVYDIIDFQYSANVCTITPKSTGSVTITISHPKAAYDQQIIVNVQQYSTFGFPDTNLTTTQGNVKFLTMQVPTTNATTYISYSVDDSSICSITGTKSVAQLTAISAGTTTIRADLIASSTGVVQASSECMVYVQKKSVDTAYISSSTTIYTVQKGKSQTITATISGTDVETNDSASLKWTTSDSDIVSVTGISSDGYVTGKSIYVTAKAAGEAIITCTHEKAASALQFYVVVPGSSSKVVTLNKSYITLTNGSSGTTISATVENAESNEDYNNLEWKLESLNTVDEIARVMGSGKTVTIYPIKTGEATLTVSLPDSASTAKCSVIVEANKSLTFDTSSVSVQPAHTKTIGYKVSPANATLNWVYTYQSTGGGTQDVFSFRDLGCDSDGNGKVEIIGEAIGSGTLAATTDGNAKGQMSVRVAWDYSFSVKGSSTFSCEPNEVKTFNYTVNPTDADVYIDSTDAGDIFNYSVTDNGDGTGTIEITGLKETSTDVSIKVIATNPNNNDEEIGTKKITGKFRYGSVSATVNVTNLDGNFSEYDSGILYVGDGEKVKLNVGLTPVGANISNVTMTFSNNSDVSKTLLSGGSNNEWTFTSPSEDITENEYLINSCYLPCLDGTVIATWDTSFNWYVGNHKHGDSTDCTEIVQIYNGNSFNFNTSYCMRGYTYNVVSYDDDDSANYGRIAEQTACEKFLKEHYGYRMFFSDYDYSKQYRGKTPDWKTNNVTFSLKEAPELAGKIYSQKEFEKIGWFYCVGTLSNKTGTLQNYDEGDAYLLKNSGTWGVNASLVEDGYLNCIDDKEGHWVCVYPHVLTDVVDATLRTSTDTKTVSTQQIGTLVISYTHNDEESKVNIPVYSVVRNCQKNLSN